MIKLCGWAEVRARGMSVSRAHGVKAVAGGVIGINLGQRSNNDIDTAIAFFRLKIPAGKSRGKDTKRRLFAGCRLL